MGKTILSGIASLDAAMGGAAVGEVTMICGRSGSGKSMLAMNWAIAAARAGHRVLVVTLDDEPKDWAVRAISHMAKVSVHKVLGASQQSDDEFDAVRAASVEFGKLPIRIGVGQTATLFDVQKGIAEASDVMGKVDLLIVDPVDLMARGMGGFRATAFGLLDLARELNVAVIAVVRSGGRAEKSVASVSDQSLLIREEDEDKRTADLIVDIRGGGEATIPVLWSGATMTVADPPCAEKSA